MGTDIVTRFEVIDENGVAYARTSVSVQLAYQDGDRTLKVFVQDLPVEKAAAARDQYARELSAVLGALAS